MTHVAAKNFEPRPSDSHKSIKFKNASPGPAHLLPMPEKIDMVSMASIYVASSYFIPNSDNAGKLFKPAFILGPSNVKGLVILVHGQTDRPDNQPYEYLTRMDHLGSVLAQNGFVCASIRATYSSPVTLVDEIANRILHHIVHLIDTYGASLYLSSNKPLGLVGHSQAGPAVLEAASHLRDNQTKGFKQVTAVASLAGTANEDPLSDFCPSFLVLRGTHDLDNGQSTPISIRPYEAATKVDERFFLWLHGCNHVQMLAPVPGSILTASQQDGVGALEDADKAKLVARGTQSVVVRQYIAMFFLWKMAGISKYRDIFVGTKIINFASYSEPYKTELLTKFRGLPRYDRERNISTLGSPQFQHVTVTGPSQLLNLHVTCKIQTTQGYLIRWQKSANNPKPLIRVPCSKAIIENAPVAFEFHAVMVGNSEFNSNQVCPVDVYLEYQFLPDEVQKSKLVRVHIEPSLTMITADKADENATVTTPSTIRISRSAFELTDWWFSKVVSLVIDLNPSPSAGEMILVRPRAAFA